MASLMCEEQTSYKFGFQEKKHMNEEEDWEDGNVFFGGCCVFVLGRLVKVLKDLTPDGYPSFHFSR